jgi:hypothetical protein
MAETASSTRPPRLSTLFRDVRLRAAFERAEREDPPAAAILPAPVRPLPGFVARPLVSTL